MMASFSAMFRNPFLRPFLSPFSSVLVENATPRGGPSVTRENRLHGELFQLNSNGLATAILPEVSAISEVTDAIPHRAIPSTRLLAMGEYVNQPRRGSEARLFRFFRFSLHVSGIVAKLRRQLA